MPGANSTSTNLEVDETVKTTVEEKAKAAIIGVGNFVKHTDTRKEVGATATFAAVSAVSVKSTERGGVSVATVEGTELGGYTGV